MTKKVTTAKDPKKQETAYNEPKNLSKTGMWMKNHPKGFCEVLDWRAVLK